MIASKRVGRSMMVWKWGDNEIENPRILREQLNTIQAEGFSDVMATLHQSRYEIIDPKVVRAATQASQWAKARGLMFWLVADPRHASRTLIARTGERLQYLVFSNIQSDQEMSLCKVSQGRFEIFIHFQSEEKHSFFPKYVSRLEPVGLERVFLFQMEDGQILKDSLIDITGASRLFINNALGRVEIFGEVGAPDQQEWQVLAFSKFNTDLYDFAGRESTDAMRDLVGSLFEHAAYIDGLAWEAPDIWGGNYIPVSDSICNAFRVQYGYDLRDQLFALVLDVDDGSHVCVRHHYSQHLTETILEAQSDLYAFFHSYFGEIETTLPVLWSRHQQEPPRLVSAKFDTWQALKGPSVAFGEISDSTQIDSIMARLCLLRSQGALSKSLLAFASFCGTLSFHDEDLFWCDLLSFFSVHWCCTQKNGLDASGHKPRDVRNSFQDRASEWNRRFEEIEQITGFRFPTADTAVIIPVNTFLMVSSEIGDELWRVVCTLTARLLRAGVQVDMVFSSLLDQTKLTREGIRIGARTYRALIFPYPIALTPQSLDLIAAMDRLHYPLFLGGEVPEFLTTGEHIPHRFSQCFDPESDDLSPLFEAGVRKRFDLPEGALASEIVNLQNRFVLVMPDRPGGVVNGLLRFNGHEIQLSGLNRLGIFRVDGNGGKIMKVF